MNKIEVSRPDPWTEVTTSTGNFMGLETKVTMKKEEGYAKTVPKKFVHPQKNVAKGYSQAYADGYARIDWDNQLPAVPGKKDVV